MLIDIDLDLTAFSNATKYVSIIMVLFVQFTCAVNRNFFPTALPTCKLCNCIFLVCFPNYEEIKTGLSNHPALCVCFLYALTRVPCTNKLQHWGQNKLLLLDKSSVNMFMLLQIQLQ
jgi:hypothetical protein